MKAERGWCGFLVRSVDFDSAMGNQESEYMTDRARAPEPRAGARKTGTVSGQNPKRRCSRCNRQQTWPAAGAFLCGPP